MPASPPFLGLPIRFKGTGFLQRDDDGTTTLRKLAEDFLDTLEGEFAHAPDFGTGIWMHCAPLASGAKPEAALSQQAQQGILDAIKRGLEKHLGLKVQAADIRGGQLRVVLETVGAIYVDLPTTSARTAGPEAAGAS